jgi:hypothetical protein
MTCLPFLKDFRGRSRSQGSDILVIGRDTMNFAAFSFSWAMMALLAVSLLG